MTQAYLGDWVQIDRVILKPSERAPGLPPETARVPFEMKAKGFLKEDAAGIGDVVGVETVTGREEQGKLIAINPSYAIDFGYPQPELLRAGINARKMLAERGENSGR